MRVAGPECVVDAALFEEKAWAGVPGSRAPSVGLSYSVPWSQQPKTVGPVTELSFYGEGGARCSRVVVSASDDGGRNWVQFAEFTGEAVGSYDNGNNY